MNEQWRLVMVKVANDWSTVSYYSPNGWGEGWDVRTYMAEKYPNVAIPEKKDKEKKGWVFGYLIQALLAEGYEPFGATVTHNSQYSGNQILCFRKRLI